MMDIRRFGLIGYPLGHSFSKRYFTEKFEREQIDFCSYELYPLQTLRELPALLARVPELVGLNVTIPYKEEVMRYCDRIHPEAKEVGAVNTLKRVGDQLYGFNSDVFGFQQSLQHWLPAADRPGQALVLGTGGASRAVVFVLQKMGIQAQLVSRTPGQAAITYDDLDENSIRTHRLIINTTPLGMAPETDRMPAIPYRFLLANHYIYDLIYNPEETRFMQMGAARGATTKNGLEMLYLQAERSWSIWNSALE